ncbi:hypothetical protein [Kitasatospora sp. NPDC056531]|uniref:hypothetical protein n=1 Tax=Kitasatospora sp. NPDC056531 TaxID=3345856 RepID=UPI00367CBDAD
MATTLSRKRYEIRLINSRSPHFLLVECWGLWDPDQHRYLRVRGSSDRIRRFYTHATAEAYLRSTPGSPL